MQTTGLENPDWFLISQSDYWSHASAWGVHVNPLKFWIWSNAHHVGFLRGQSLNPCWKVKWQQFFKWLSCCSYWLVGCHMLVMCDRKVFYMTETLYLIDYFVTVSATHPPHLPLKLSRSIICMIFLLFFFLHKELLRTTYLQSRPPRVPRRRLPSTASFAARRPAWPPATSAGTRACRQILKPIPPLSYSSE